MSKQATILVVDDDCELRSAVQMLLEAASFKVLSAANGSDAINVLECQSVDLIVADIAMPIMNGYQLFDRVCANERWAGIPFVLLSARTLDSDIRYGKELGVDDYLVKPLESADLLASVRGKLKRARARANNLHSTGAKAVPDHSEMIRYGPLSIDAQKHHVWFSDRRVSLSGREYRLLLHLVQNKGAVIPSQKLVNVTHDIDTDANEAGVLVRPMIRSLRRKLGYPAGEMGCIENIRGAGYQFVVPD